MSSHQWKFESALTARCTVCGYRGSLAYMMIEGTICMGPGRTPKFSLKTRGIGVSYFKGWRGSPSTIYLKNSDSDHKSCWSRIDSNDARQLAQELLDCADEFDAGQQ